MSCCFCFSGELQWTVLRGDSYEEGLKAPLGSVLTFCVTLSPSFNLSESRLSREGPCCIVMWVTIMKVVASISWALTTAANAEWVFPMDYLLTTPDSQGIATIFTPISQMRKRRPAEIKYPVQG